MKQFLRYENFLELPSFISEYLLGNIVTQVNDEFRIVFALSDEQIGLISLLESKLLCRDILPEEIFEKLEMVGFDPESAQKITEKLLLDFCGPISWYFEDLSGAAESQNIDLPASFLFSVEQPTITLEQILNQIGSIIDDVPERVKAGLKQFLVESIKNEEDTEVIFEKMQQPITNSGFGLSAERARAVTDVLRNIVGVYAIEGGGSFETTAPKKTNSSVEIPKEFLDEEEAEEIAQNAEAAASVSSAPLTAEQKHLIEAVLAIEPLDDRSGDLQTRWKMIVEARIGGARDAAKTKSLLQTAAENGGLGLSFEETNRLANLLEETAARFEKHREDYSVMEKIASVEKNTATIVAGPEAVSDKSQKQLNERFVSMFGKNAVAEIRNETRREIESFSSAHPGEVEHAELMVSPQAQTAATISPEPKYVPKVPEKLKQLIDAENPVFPIKPKAAAPVAPVVKKSGDIRPGTRLVGPIDELRILTLIDFRRLASDASVRIQKIRSKIDVISRDGAHEKIRAVQAFEQSEPVRLYRELLRASLIQQVDIEEMNDRYKTEGKPFLEPEEIEQLGVFLSQIRYANV